MAPPPPTSTWPHFHRHWGGLHNFLITDEITAFNYQPPPLERIIEEVRHHSLSIVRSGVKADAFDLTDIKDDFRALPLDQAFHSRFVLAHFALHPHLSGPGQVFEGIEEGWVQPWRRRLLDHGFTFESVFAILFASGPGSASNYHMDRTHQLAWQCHGTKHFHGLTDPDGWTTREQRGACDLVTSRRPAGLGEADTYAIVQRPGTMLWNTVAIPHWVETFDGPAATLTLVHKGLRLQGKLCPHSQEREAWLASRPAAQPSHDGILAPVIPA